jgi:membrane-associated phospholipid phosphatase
MLIAALVLVLGVADAQPATDDGLVFTAPAVEAAQAPAPATPDADDAAQPPVQAPAGSDAPPEAKEPPTPAHTGLRALGKGLVGDFQHLPSPENAYLALLGGALAVAAHPADQTFNVHLRSHYTTVNAAFAPAKYVGNTPEQIALSLGTYAYGRIFAAPKVSHLGMDLLRAQILTTALVQPIKIAAQRERPDGSNSHSFPSGHAAITFAGATVLERHLGWRKAALAYALAAYVGASRLHDNRHYLSDVAFGAAVGTIAGRTVTQHGRNVWTLVPAHMPDGMMILAVYTGSGD